MNPATLASKFRENIENMFLLPLPTISKSWLIGVMKVITIAISLQKSIIIIINIILFYFEDEFMI